MNPSELEKEYREIYRPLYEAFANRLTSLLSEILANAGISVAQIEYRAKTVESFLGKIEKKSYSEPFKEIKDFAGIRVITHYHDAVTQVASLIYDEFNVDKNHSSDKLDRLEVDEFGYRSFHLVCSLDNTRAKLPEWKKYSHLEVEIQIRSILQHAWAIISHKLDYKSARQAPRVLRRQLFRLSALLELADEEFASVRDKSTNIIELYKEKIHYGQLNIPIDLDSLTEYMEERVDLEEWERIGLAVGLLPADPNPGEYHRALEALLDTLVALRLQTVGEFDSLLRKHKSQAEPILFKLKDVAKQYGANFEAYAPYLINEVIAIAERDSLPEGFQWPKLYRPEIKSVMQHLLAWE